MKENAEGSSSIEDRKVLLMTDRRLFDDRPNRIVRLSRQKARDHGVPSANTFEE